MEMTTVKQCPGGNHPFTPFVGIKGGVYPWVCAHCDWIGDPSTLPEYRPEPSDKITPGGLIQGETLRDVANSGGCCTFGVRLLTIPVLAMIAYDIWLRVGTFRFLLPRKWRVRLYFFFRVVRQVV